LEPATPLLYTPSDKGNAERNSMRTGVKVLAAVVGLVLLIIILIPFLVNGETFRPTLRAASLRPSGAK